MLRFASLGSGSKGNATLVATDETLLLIDCGYSAVEVRRRMAPLGVDPADITAILVTHEHGDHIKGVPVLSRKYGIPVHLTHGTLRGCRDDGFHRVHVISPHRPFRLGDIDITPYPVPHDTGEPCQFVFTHEGCRLGLLTDAGSITPHMIEALDGCHALMLECNYDPDMLANGPYPPALQRRIDDRFGHLANHQARDLLAALDTSRLRALRLMHLSEKNNHPDLALAALRDAVPVCCSDVQVASQGGGFGWVDLCD